MERVSAFLAISVSLATAAGCQRDARRATAVVPFVRAELVQLGASTVPERSPSPEFEEPVPTSSPGQTSAGASDVSEQPENDGRMTVEQWLAEQAAEAWYGSDEEQPEAETEEAESEHEATAEARAEDEAGEVDELDEVERVSGVEPPEAAADVAENETEPQDEAEDEAEPQDEPEPETAAPTNLVDAEAQARAWRRVASLFGAGSGFTATGAGESGFTGIGAGEGFTGYGAGSGFTGVTASAPAQSQSAARAMTTEGASPEQTVVVFVPSLLGTWRGAYLTY